MSCQRLVECAVARAWSPRATGQIAHMAVQRLARTSLNTQDIRFHTDSRMNRVGDKWLRVLRAPTLLLQPSQGHRSSRITWEHRIEALDNLSILNHQDSPLRQGLPLVLESRELGRVREL